MMVHSKTRLMAEHVARLMINEPGLTVLVVTNDLWEFESFLEVAVQKLSKKFRQLRDRLRVHRPSEIKKDVGYSWVKFLVFGADVESREDRSRIISLMPIVRLADFEHVAVTEPAATEPAPPPPPLVPDPPEPEPFSLGEWWNGVPDFNALHERIGREIEAMGKRHAAMKAPTTDEECAARQAELEADGEMLTRHGNQMEHVHRARIRGPVERYRRNPPVGLDAHGWSMAVLAAAELRVGKGRKWRFEVDSMHFTLMAERFRDGDFSGPEGAAYRKALTLAKPPPLGPWMARRSARR